MERQPKANKSIHSIPRISLIDFFSLKNEKEKYYNSMLKVISWYKLNHKWKTTWIWWKLAGMKWYEFMNEMTFKPLSNNKTKLSFWIALPNGQFKESWFVELLAAREKWMSENKNFVFVWMVSFLRRSKPSINQLTSFNSKHELIELICWIDELRCKDWFD